MPQVQVAAIVEILRSGSPQLLFATIATCTVKVANAKHVRTVASFGSGHCFGLAVVPRPGAIGESQPGYRPSGAIAVAPPVGAAFARGWAWKRNMRRWCMARKNPLKALCLEIKGGPWWGRAEGCGHKRSYRLNHRATEAAKLGVPMASSPGKRGGFS
jgi:hypothetical protein